MYLFFEVLKNFATWSKKIVELLVFYPQNVQEPWEHKKKITSFCTCVTHRFPTKTLVKEQSESFFKVDLCYPTILQSLFTFFRSQWYCQRGKWHRYSGLKIVHSPKYLFYYSMSLHVRIYVSLLRYIFKKSFDTINKLEKRLCVAAQFCHLFHDRQQK